MPLSRVLWHDMLVVGTVVNVATGLAGLLLFANEAPTALAASVYFAPLPYNVFLLAAVWRGAEQAAAAQAAIARAVSLVWTIAVILI